MENNFVENEHKILKFWEEKKILEKLKEKNKKTGKRPWSFLDGPITANNPMGVHHAWGRTYKDMFQRYKAMHGYEQRFQNGFDCQGLWVEVEVEKELGFKNKKDIEKYDSAGTNESIEKFVNKCKERVHKYSKIQTEQSIRLGMLRDWGNWQTDFDEKGEWLKQSKSYYTMSDGNNYAIWYFLKRCYEQGLLYKGRDSVPWCWRCGTAISQHEILQEEYKEITHQAVYVKFPIIGQEKTYFLAWTTTPWTLPGNIALAVNPEFDYVVLNPKFKIQMSNQAQNPNVKFVLLKDMAKELFGEGDFEIEKEIKGKELEGLEYEGIFDELEAVKNALGDYKHKVILWKEITAEDGTGIVHIAPGCGAEDFQLSKDLGLPVIDLTDNESNYREGLGELSGKFVASEEVREWIFNDLKNKGLVFKIKDYKHRYPTCWRCKSELIFRVVDEWYIAMNKLREPLKQTVEKINWIPGFCLERELDWLKNMQDWLISKKRYWGLALPIWECECGNFEVVGSKEELKTKAVEGWDNFENHSPHRPWVDDVKIKCSKCGETISRVSDVGNPWLDAGIVSFSTISGDNRSEGIPYFQGTKEGREEWQKWFPAELVCESFPGQFKNWFYVLLVMSEVLESSPPFKNLLGFASVVDEKGEEMHKSKGNAIWFDEAIEKIGADVMRWMYITQNPAYNMKFGYNVAKETQRKILTLWNSFIFFKTYGLRMPNAKCQMPNKIQNPKSRNVLDRWIMSRLNGLIKTTTESLDSFDVMRASHAIEDFWIQDLSLWYIRRSRKRFQNPESGEDQEQAEKVLYAALLTLAKIIAPMMPFLAETIYQDLREESMPESVHLCDWPTEASPCPSDLSAIALATVEVFDEGGAKAGWPAIDEVLEKQMAEVRRLSSLALAKRADLKIGVRQALSKIKIQKSKFKSLSQNLKLLELIKEEVNVREIIFDESIEGEIELDTKITDELKEDGLVREVVRQIQDLRKKAGLTPQDKASVYFTASSDLAAVIFKNQEQILSATRSITLREVPGKIENLFGQKELTIDNLPFWLGIRGV